MTQIKLKNLTKTVAGQPLIEAPELTASGNEIVGILEQMALEKLLSYVSLPAKIPTSTVLEPFKAPSSWSIK